MRLLLIISLLALLGTAPKATACSCMWERDTIVTEKMLADSSIHIFTGEVVRAKKVFLKDDLGRKILYNKVTVRLKETLKSPSPVTERTITIYTGTNINLDCGVPFSKDETYFIVTSLSKQLGGLYTNYCYPNKPLADASRDIARLKN
jgi:hypothetical protein